MTIRFLRPAALAGCLSLTLAACGSSGSNPDDPPPPPPPTGDLKEAAALAQALRSDPANPFAAGSAGDTLLGGVIAAESAPVPDPVALAGGARYEGGMIAQTQEGVFVSGAMVLDADFDRDAVAGTISQIRDHDDGVTFGGSLGIDGKIDGFGLRAEIDGSLSRDGGSFGVTGEMAGEFRGTQAGMVAGDLSLAAPAAGVVLTGVFYAEN